MALDIDHVGIAVRSTDEIVSFYEQAFGLRLIHQENLAEHGVKVTFLGADDGRTTIELAEPLRENTGTAKFLRERGPGLHHICFRVRDIRAELARLAGLGFDLVQSEPVRGSRGHLVAFVHPRSTHGVLIELLQDEEGA